MLTRRTVLALLSALAHTALALGIAINIGTVAQSPSWALFARLGFPDWIWPSIFLAIGLMALGGVADLRMLRASLYGGAMVMAAWSIALLAAMLSGAGIQPSVIWLLYIGALKWLLADADVKLDSTRQAIREITQQATETLEGTH